MHFLNEKYSYIECFIPRAYFKLWFICVLLLISKTHHLLYDLSEGIIKDNLVATLPLLESTYSVSFNIKPLLYSAGWKSIIHLTTGNNCGNYGARTPAIFFNADASGRLYITSAINSYAGCGAEFNSEPLPLNQWTSIQISQFQKNGVHLFAVYINGINVYSNENKIAQSFQNVQVYVSDPWYDAQSGFIKNLRINNGNQDLFYDLGESLFSYNNLVAVLPSLESTYSVSFKLKPLSYSYGWKNLIHLTIGNSNFGNYGDRTPAVFFHDDGSGRLYIASATNGYTGPLPDFISNPLPLNKWSWIRISQFQINEVFIFAVYIDGINVYSSKNKHPQSFENVKVYISDPWHDAQNGLIKDFRIISGNEEVCGLLASTSTNNKHDEIHVLINLTTNCLCPILQTKIYLQHTSSMLFKKFVWDDLLLNDSLVQDNGNFSIIHVGELSKNFNVVFTAIFVYVEIIPNGITNVAVQICSSWICCYQDLVIKSNLQTVVIPVDRSLSVIKMNPNWAYKQPNGTFLQTQNLQFVCGPLQKRQQSPCYQHEISSGIVTFLPIQVMEVIGYDIKNTLIYGRTLRSNLIEVNLKTKKTIVISSEKYSKIKACDPS